MPIYLYLPPLGSLFRYPQNATAQETIPNIVVIKNKHAKKYSRVSRAATQIAAASEKSGSWYASRLSLSF